MRGEELMNMTFEVANRMSHKSFFSTIQELAVWFQNCKKPN